MAYDHVERMIFVLQSIFLLVMCCLGRRDEGVLINAGLNMPNINLNGPSEKHTLWRMMYPPIYDWRGVKGTEDIRNRLTSGNRGISICKIPKTKYVMPYRDEVKSTHFPS